MSNYIISVTNPTGDTGTIVPLPDGGFSYTDNLNQMNTAQIAMSGSSISKRSLFVMGSTISISRNGSVAFKGLIRNLNYLSGGGIVCSLDGYEVWLAMKKGAYAGSPWKATASATIFSAIIAESTKFTAGTIATGTNLDFREIASESLYSALSNLARKTEQDVVIDYSGDTVIISDHKGSSTSVGTFNDQLQISNLRVNYTYPAGNVIRVYGKGDGVNQITATATDATSVAAYGSITRDVTDVSVVSTSEATLLANAELAISKDPTEIYDFDFLNPSTDIVAGDVITLNAPDRDVANKQVRIVGLERGMRNGVEFLTAQVVNQAYSKLIKNRNLVIATIEKSNRDSTTFMQGSTNLMSFPQLINGNSTAPLRIVMNLPTTAIYDEAGNRRVNSFTLDYDVDPYRKGVANSDDTDDKSTGNSVTVLVHGAPDQGYALGSYTDTSLTGNNAWQEVINGVSVSGATYLFHAIHGTFIIDVTNGGTGVSVPVNVYVRAHNDTDNTYYPNSTGFLLTTGFSTQYDSTLTIPFYIHIPYNWTDKTWYLQYKISNENYWAGGIESVTYFYHGSQGHVHDDTYNDPTHYHTVTIGDGASDSGSINATSVNIYVDFWNGSSWTNKHSILTTGKTIDTNVDISNGNTLPDAAGFWRVRITTNSASSDLINGIVQIKHHLDA